MNRRSFTLLLLCGIAWTATGCGSQDDQPSSQASADPRFVSAEALIEHLNRVILSHPVDAGEFESLFYAENDKQRDLLGIFSASLMTIELDRAMLDRFDELFDEAAGPNGLEYKFAQPARLYRPGTDRAEARAVDWLDEAWNFHLVKISDRWWISGYTFEYDPLWQELDEEMVKLIPYIRLMRNLTRAVSGDLGRRTKKGEFDTGQAVRRAFMPAIVEYAKANPSQAKAISDYLRDHPEQRNIILDHGMEAMLELSR
jgi:hypothetical protein